MQFGNWKIGDEEVEFSGGGFERFVIPVNDLLDRIDATGEGEDMYKWIILAMAEDSITADDLYDLNFAIAYTAGRAGMNLDYEVLDRTIEFQYQVLDDEDDEDDDDGLGIQSVNLSAK